MVLLGGASYSVYLLRYPVTSWTRLLISGLPAPFVRLGELLAPVLLVLFSILVFRYWEEPSRKALRRWFARERLWLSGISAAPSPNARG
jgi:peptidoglycan/LPS O-acetylase OafA/YrhL